jgi:hypothetical protein
VKRFDSFLAHQLFLTNFSIRQHRLGLHDHQGGAIRATPWQEDPKESVPPTELWTLDRSGQRGQLLTEREILERDGSVSATD